MKNSNYDLGQKLNRIQSQGVIILDKLDEILERLDQGLEFNIDKEELAQEIGKELSGSDTSAVGLIKEELSDRGELE